MTISVVKIRPDLGSEEVKLLRLQVNKLTTAVQAIFDAATVDGNTFMAAVAALTELDEFETLVDSYGEIPKLPQTS